ncbi:hypothetical protein D0T49_12965 [Paludibacter sp. 221]|uniref:hypothetical protein n=1 Tax=Paludibacter sp. 221 TaxID=2302939 RepID=UPI0013D24179|nr:hypothetical protein [Paludibacter sp. 221]NDV47955.1 hypothetical protein [Paludibacter sp. 221]
MKINDEFLSIDHLKVCAGEMLGVDPEKIRVSLQQCILGVDSTLKFSGVAFILRANFLRTATGNGNFFVCSLKNDNTCIVNYNSGSIPRIYEISTFADKIVTSTSGETCFVYYEFTVF